MCSGVPVSDYEDTFAPIGMKKVVKVTIQIFYQHPVATVHNLSQYL